jgi:uroporphyrinogen-III synthase
MQKNNITILSTGALDKEMVDNAFELDIIIETIPFIATRPVSSEELRKVVDPLVQQRSFIIITSSNAVEPLVQTVQVRPKHWIFFCVGHATRSRIEKFFGATSIAAVADNATELAREIVKSGIKNEMIFFCGDQRRDELPDQLRASGIAIKEVVVYETTTTPQGITKQYEGIIFSSPSAVQSFFSLNQPGPDTVLFAIGSTTAEALQGFTKNKIVVADKPGKEEVVNKVIEYFKQ